MPKLKVLSGKELISIFALFGFGIKSQKGSHIKLVRENFNIKQSLTIPNHKELDKGTLKAIIRQATRYINESELFDFFYE